MGLREAKANLSRIVERVRRGQIVTITVRGKKVVRIVPVYEDAMTVQDRVDDLVAAGVVSPPSKKSRATGTIKPIEVDEEGIGQRYLREDRDGR